MAESPKQSNRRIPVIVLFERDLIDRSDAVAHQKFEGNRSLLVRTAVRELVERIEGPVSEPKEAVAS